MIYFQKIVICVCKIHGIMIHGIIGTNSTIMELTDIFAPIPKIFVITGIKTWSAAVLKHAIAPHSPKRLARNPTWMEHAFILSVLDMEIVIHIKQVRKCMQETWYFFEFLSEPQVLNYIIKSFVIIFSWLCLGWCSLWWMQYYLWWWPKKLYQTKTRRG